MDHVMLEFKHKKTWGWDGRHVGMYLK